MKSSIDLSQPEVSLVNLKDVIGPPKEAVAPVAGIAKLDEKPAQASREDLSAGPDQQEQQQEKQELEQRKIEEGVKKKREKAMSLIRFV